MLLDLAAEVLLGDLRAVLRREHDRVDRARHEPLVADGDLRLAVGPQVRELARVADGREALGEAVR
ncbi:hypothetical protein MAFF212519_15530 [Clavibacter michiganensis]